MKRIILTIVAVALCASTVSAQRYLPGQMGIELAGGFGDGFKLKKQDGQAFYGNVSVSAYNKKQNRWVFGAEYFQRGFDYRGELIPLAQFTAEGGHYVKFLSDPTKTVFLSVGASALAGYETLNWGKRQLPDGARIAGKDGFIYGGAVSLEVETYLSDRIVLLVRARERIVFGTTLKHFHFQLGAGLKFIIK